jgi:hypothetical protein
VRARPDAYPLGRRVTAGYTSTASSIRVTSSGASSRSRMSACLVCDFTVPTRTPMTAAACCSVRSS